MRFVATAIVALAASSCASPPSEPETLSPALRESDVPASRSIDRVIGLPALLANGTRVVSRAGDEPGESDLFVFEVDGRFRALAPAPGPDDLPTALPDGRIAFVSGRTGLASLY